MSNSAQVGLSSALPNQPRPATAGGAPRLVLCLDHAAQHFSTAFSHLSESSTVDARVLYWTPLDEGQFDAGFSREVRWDVDLYAGYAHDHVKGASLVSRTLSAVRLLRRCDPEVLVVYGWASPIARIAIIWALVHGRRLLFYGDSTWQHSARPRLLWIRKVILRRLFTKATGALSTGAFNREFYIMHGMHPAKVLDCVCPVDVTAFANARTGRTTGSVLTIGFAGKLTARKAVDELLRALALLPSDVHWRSRIIGDGPQRGELERLADRLGILDRVTFAGFHNTSQMPAQLANCDIVVVPSRRDLRVLVAAEAMAAGAAVVVSSNTAVWGPADLIEHKISGAVYESGSPSSLADVLTELAGDRDLLEEIRRNGERRAQEYSPATFATRLEKAVAATYPCLSG